MSSNTLWTQLVHRFTKVHLIWIELIRRERERERKRKPIAELLSFPRCVSDRLVFFCQMTTTNWIMSNPSSSVFRLNWCPVLYHCRSSGLFSDDKRSTSQDRLPLSEPSWLFLSISHIRYTHLCLFTHSHPFYWKQSIELRKESKTKWKKGWWILNFFSLHFMNKHRQEIFFFFHCPLVKLNLSGLWKTRGIEFIYFWSKSKDEIKIAALLSNWKTSFFLFFEFSFLFFLLFSPDLMETHSVDAEDQASNRSEETVKSEESDREMTKEVEGGAESHRDHAFHLVEGVTDQRRRPSKGGVLSNLLKLDVFDNPPNRPSHQLKSITSSRAFLQMMGAPSSARNSLMADDRAELGLADVAAHRIAIASEIADILSRQDVVIKLGKALVKTGAPSHRIVSRSLDLGWILTLVFRKQPWKKSVDDWRLSEIMPSCLVWSSSPLAISRPTRPRPTSFAVLVRWTSVSSKRQIISPVRWPRVSSTSIRPPRCWTTSSTVHPPGVRSRSSWPTFSLRPLLPPCSFMALGSTVAWAGSLACVVRSFIDPDAYWFDFSGRLDLGVWKDTDV